MKATLSTNYRALSTEISRLTSELEDLRTQAATGKKLNAPSDDPAAIRPVLSARSQISSTDRFIESISTAVDRLDNQDTYLDTVENLLVSAKEKAINAINGTLSDADLETLATSIGYIKEQMISLGNSQVGGQYIFSGFLEDTQAFVADGDFVSYQGDNNIKRLEASPGEYIQTNLAGSEVFQGLKDVDGDGTLDQVGENIFDMLTNLEYAMRGYSGQDVQLYDGSGNPVEVRHIPELTDLLGTLESSADQVRSARGRMGNNAERLETSKSHLESVRIDLEGILSRYEDADIVDVITEITQTETAFKGALQVTSQVSELSILDYL
ncbi:MAG: flagellar hook-associated protein FlgL [Desulfuromonadaceae bacterium]|nr:flagellar hook-associated protein FlgL [Desulfuromonadaceae bacterium]